MTFRENWFNPLYFILNDLLKDNSIRTILIYGGKSSAKTVSICQILCKESAVNQSSSIAFRKESTTIKTTLKKSFDLAIKSMWLGDLLSPFEFSYRSSGSEIILKGLDESEKSKGIESYKYVYLDELNHFSEEEFEQFNLSLRGIVGQKIFASWNPVDEQSWLKTHLIDPTEWLDTEYKLPCENSFVKRSASGKTILIKTTFEDNYWIYGGPGYGYRDENLIAAYAELKSRNYNSYRVNVLGEWGKIQYGGEFLKCWKSEIHTGNYPYNPELAIYLYFDENVVPYFPCGFFQVGKDNLSVKMIHCIAAKTPNNKITSMGREIVRKLTEWGHTQLVYVGGDATSQKDDVKLEQGDDMFRLIMAEIRSFKPRRQTNNSNPSVRMSADFVNSILESNAQGLSFGVDVSCKTAILDFENTKEDKNGKVDKSTVTDPISKVSYQPYGHFCDIVRYMFTTVFSSEYGQYQRGGGKSFSSIQQGKRLPAKSGY
jgi:phage terminase large subunit